MTDHNQRREFIKRMIAVGGVAAMPAVTSFPLRAEAAALAQTGGGGNTTSGGNTGGGGNTTSGTNTGGGGNTTSGTNTGGGGNTTNGTNTGGGGNTTNGTNTGGGGNTTNGTNTGGGGNTTNGTNTGGGNTAQVRSLTPTVTAPVTVATGESFTATGFDMAPECQIALYLVPSAGGAKLSIGSVVANTEGGFNTILTTPSDLATGSYVLEAHCEPVLEPLIATWSMMVVGSGVAEPAASPAQSTTGAAPELAFTGRDTTPFTAAAAGLLAAGSAALAAERMRSKKAASEPTDADEGSV